MTQITKTRKSEITTGSVNRVVKDGRTLGYLVKSDSSDTYYQVRYLNGKLHCSCPATVECCKHIRAIVEIGECRKAAKAAYDVVTEAAQVANDHLLDSFYAEVGDPRTSSYCGDCGKLSGSAVCYRCSN